MTAAMLVESGKVKDVIISQEIYTAMPEASSRQQTKPKLADKIQRWLSDKVMFSKKQKPWMALLWIFNFFHMYHPSNSQRIKSVITQNNISQNPTSSLGDSFWAGVAIGLLSVIVGLGSYWFAVFIQKPPEDINIIRLPFDVYGMISMIPPGFLALFLALPVWSSLKQPTLNRYLFLSLLARYAIALAGACLVCPLILIAGAVNQDVLLLLAICVLWNIFITVFSYGVSAILISLWVTIRYLQSGHMSELRKGMCAFGLFIIAISILIAIGIILISNDMMFYGASVIFSTIAGGAFVSLTVRGTRFSEAEQYIILCAPFLIFRFEGKWFKTLIYVIHSFYSTVLLFIYAPLIYFVTDFVFGNIHFLDSILGIFIAIGASCTVMIILERNGLKKTSENKRSKIQILHHCLKLLSKPSSFQIHQKINKVASSYDLGMKGIKNRTLNLTMHNAYEVISLILDDTSQNKTPTHVSKWVLRCQTEGGFGLWPTSSPRLNSTYQAISILRDIDLLDKCSVNKHISWIKTLQQPDGCFKDPKSRRERWEDTFYAVKSLDMLGCSLEPDKVNLCRNMWRQILIEKGIKENRADITYHCFGVLATLGKVDDNVSKLLSDWLSSAIEELLLTNISLDYEKVHFTIMTYNLFDGDLNISSESVNLLTDRIQLALNAELADIRM